MAWQQVGSDIDGEYSFNGSGDSVSLSNDGTILAIGSRRNYGSGNNGAGHVRVFENTNGNWIQIGRDIEGETILDSSGSSISLSSDGSIIAIGADHNDDNGSQSGHVRVFQNVDDDWVQLGSDIDGEATDDQSGRSVSISSDGSIIAIGAWQNDGNGNNSGHVRVYTFNKNLTQTGTSSADTLLVYSSSHEFGHNILRGDCC